MAKVIKKLIFDLDTCFFCPYRSQLVKCMHPSTARQEIDSEYTIPDWCPLPDAPESEADNE